MKSDKTDKVLFLKKDIDDFMKKTSIVSYWNYYLFNQFYWFYNNITTIYFVLVDKNSCLYKKYCVNFDYYKYF